MEVCIKEGKEAESHLPYLGVLPRADRRHCGSHVASPDGAALGGGGAGLQTPASAPKPFPPACPAPARSSTARGRARLPSGWGPLVAAGKWGRRPSGELASSWPLAGVRGSRRNPRGSRRNPRGSRRNPGGSGEASRRRRRRLPSVSGETGCREA